MNNVSNDTISNALIIVLGVMFFILILLVKFSTFIKRTLALK